MAIKVTVLSYTSEDDEWCVEDEFGYVYLVHSGEIDVDYETDTGYLI